VRVRGVSVKRSLLAVLGVAALAVVVLNWTYGRLPLTPRPTGSFVALAGGLRVRYLERPGIEPAVLLIHGLPGTAEDWNEVTAALSGRRTVAIDRPGYGFSSGGYFPIERQLQAIQELIARLHLGRPILVGHSYGGTISLAFAERHRDEVRGLVLVDAAATCTRNSALDRDEARLVKVIELPVLAQIADATFSQLVRTTAAEEVDAEAFSPAPVPRAQLHRVLAINMKHGNLEAWAGEMLAANTVIESVNHALHTIVAPVIVIQGERDKLVAARCGRRLAAALPHAQLEMISGGHMAPYTHPATVAAAVNAVSRQSATSAIRGWRRSTVAVVSTSRETAPVSRAACDSIGLDRLGRPCDTGAFASPARTGPAPLRRPGRPPTRWG
jgi:pimeloyl-ACP methyl ester carboxylesterase